MFGARAGRAMAGPTRPAELQPALYRDVASRGRLPPEGGMSGSGIRSLMWSAVGLFRHRNSLGPAVARLERQEVLLRGGLADHVPLDHDGWRASQHRDGVDADRPRGPAPGGEPRRPLRDRFRAHDDLHWKVHVSDCHAAHMRRQSKTPDSDLSRSPA